MEFKHIKDIKCPECGRGLRSATHSGVHVNGEQFESAEYLCGFRIKYSPNFSRMEVIRRCPYSADVAKEKELLESNSREIGLLIKSQTWPDNFGEELYNRILGCIKYMR